MAEATNYPPYEIPGELSSRTLEIAAVVLILAAAAALIGVMSFNRPYFNFGTETDYMALFIPEAERIRAGLPLQLAFHPPGYSFVIALVQSFTHDWFLTGRVVTFVSTIVAMGLSYLLFRLLIGPAAGIGALVACLLSPAFLIFSILAVSDMFFLALVTGCLVAAVLGTRSSGVAWWLASGVLLGIVLLTRSNGFALLPLFLAPFLLLPRGVSPFPAAVGLLVGILVPIAAWVSYAVVTGSPFAPEGNYANLAMTYYSQGDHITFESMEQVRGKYTGILDVVMRDPIFIIKHYASDLKENIVRLGTLIAFPASMLVVGGLLFTVARPRRDLWFFVFFLFLGQIAILTLKTFESRHYLFLVPLFGAAMAEIVTRLVGGRNWTPARAAATGALVVIGLWGFLASYKMMRLEAHSNIEEIADVVDRAASATPDGALIISRKPAIAYHLDRPWEIMPIAAAAADLPPALDTLSKGRPVFVYMGSAERTRRPELSAELAGPNRPAWLTEVARGPAAEGWVLYRYVSPAGAANPG